jgi:hypothetical protein
MAPGLTVSKVIIRGESFANKAYRLGAVRTPVERMIAEGLKRDGNLTDLLWNS